jgi:hypothetical protein
MTIAKTLAAIRLLPNMTATNNLGEYRVTLRQEAFGPGRAFRKAGWKRAEDIACYTDDAEDALLTAAAMSAHFALHGVE